MGRIIIAYGLIGGTIVIGAMLVGIVMLPEHGGASLWFGYLSMLVALSAIFLGVKRYRDTVGGGVVRLVPALLLGLGIAAVAGVAYVIGWEIYLAATDYAFMPKYVASAIEAKRASGLSGPALAAEIAKLKAMEAQYANPLYRMPMTFMEIFPVGLLIAIVSALLLRNPRLLPAKA